MSFRLQGADEQATACEAEAVQVLKAEIEQLLVGAMIAQDRRETEAGAKCGVSYEENGCDWPDAVADVVVALRAEVVILRGALAKISLGACDADAVANRVLRRPTTVAKLRMIEEAANAAGGGR